MAGLLEDFSEFIKTPGGQGLLSAAFGGLAGAQRGAPLNSLGRAGMAGMMGYGGALDREKATVEAEQMKKYRDMQMSQAQAQIDAAKAKALIEGKRDAAMANPWTTPVSEGSISVPEMGGVDMFSQGVKVGAPSVQGKPVLNVPALLAARVTPKEIAELDGLNNLGKQEVARTIKGTGADGKEYEYQIDKYGNKIGDGFGQWKAPLLNDGGGQTNVLDPYNPSKIVGSIPKTMTFADKNSAGQLAVSKSRLNWDMNGGGEGGTSQSGFNKQFGKPAPGYRWKADGSQEFIPGGPADQKAQLQKSGEGTVGSVVADLRDKYTLLNDGGGLVNNEKGALSNIGAWTSSTGLGQTVGGAVGTKNQNARDSVAMTRPLLLQAIMKATGMSAKQMDSNAELKMYLATATDTTKGYQANMEALDRIEKLYGGGQSANTDKPAPAGKPPMLGQVVDGYKFKGGNPSDKRNWEKQ